MLSITSRGMDRPTDDDEDDDVPEDGYDDGDHKREGRGGKRRKKKEEKSKGFVPYGHCDPRTALLTLIAPLAALSPLLFSFPLRSFFFSSVRSSTSSLQLHRRTRYARLLPRRDWRGPSRLG